LRVDGKVKRRISEEKEPRTKEWLYPLIGAGAAVLTAPLFYLLLSLVLGPFLALWICAVEIYLMVAVSSLSLSCKICGAEQPEFLQTLWVIIGTGVPPVAIFVVFRVVTPVGIVGAALLAVSLAAVTIAIYMDVSYLKAILMAVLYDIFGAIFSVIGAALLVFTCLPALLFNGSTDQKGPPPGPPGPVTTSTPPKPLPAPPITSPSISDPIKSLQDPDPVVRQAAAQAVWSLKARAKEALPELEKLLNDTSSDVRVAAARALGGMGPDAVAHLQKALANEDSRVRAAAIEGLAAMGQTAKAAQPEVRKAIGDKDPNIRRKAINCWVKLESDPQKLVAGLLPALGDADPGVSSTAQETLGKAPLDAKVVMPVLLEALQGSDDREHLGVCHVVKRLGADAKQAAPPLAAKLREGSDVRNLAILEALAAIGPDAKEAAPSIGKALDFKDARVRRASALALKTFLPPEKESVRMLAKALDDQQEPVLLAALETLKAFGPEAAEIAPALVTLALRNQGEAGRLATETLTQLGPKAVSALRQAFDAADRQGRLAILPMLQRLGPAAVPVLIHAAADESVRPAVWTVLDSMDVKAKGTLEKLLRDDDPETRVWALVAYIRRGPVEESLPAVVEALKDKDKTIHEQALEALPHVIPQGLSSSDQGIRIQAIRLVARLGPNARNMLPALEQVRDDPRSSREVREAAAAAVRRLDPRGSTKKPVPPQRKTPSSRPKNG
jgi:HEAT repeat protein